MTVLKCLVAPSTGAKLQLNHQEAIMAAQSKRASAQNVSPSLKCRKGDIAIILEGPCVGFVVDVVEYYGVSEMTDGEVLTNAWHIKHHTDDPDWNYFKEDKCLLPIRPGDLDESETDELSLTQGRSA
jgi:hypothetical protein